MVTFKEYLVLKKWSKSVKIEKTKLKKWSILVKIEKTKLKEKLQKISQYLTSDSKQLKQFAQATSTEKQEKKSGDHIAATVTEETDSVITNNISDEIQNDLKKLCELKTFLDRISGGLDVTTDLENILEEGYLSLFQAVKQWRKIICEANKNKKDFKTQHRLVEEALEGIVNLLVLVRKNTPSTRISDHSPSIYNHNHFPFFREDPKDKKRQHEPKYTVNPRDENLLKGYTTGVVLLKSQPIPISWASCLPIINGIFYIFVTILITILTLRS